jgi:biopolymer transport protein ExbD
MASSKLAARAIRNHAKYRGRNDLNIVPMIDMMVILVFFLLFTAVFSNTNILELNLPAPNSSVPELPKGLQLEVHVRHTGIDIADRNSGILRSLPMTAAAEYDYKGLSEYLQFVKSKYPGTTEASVLLESDIPYDVLVQTMDNVRLYQMNDAPLFTKVELFPDISVGDAPVTGTAAAGAAPAAPPAGGRK